MLMMGMESCDDGNTDAGDGCSPTCELEAGFNCANAPLTVPLNAVITSKPEQKTVMMATPKPKAVHTDLLHVRSVMLYAKKKRVR